MKMPFWNGASALPGRAVVRFHRRHRRSENGLTRLELLALVGAIMLLTLVSVPLGANVRTRTDRLVCEANLRQIGHGYQLWASDHSDRNPFLVPTNEGGIYGVALGNNLWFQYAWISNELATPSVLACPSDTGTTRVATDFSYSPNGGFLNPNYRNNAVSYFLGLHSFFYSPRSILGGDRNIKADASNVGCSRAGLSFTVLFGPGFVPPDCVWTNSIHGFNGNLLYNDGSVQETSTVELQTALTASETEGSRIHALVPR